MGQVALTHADTISTKYLHISVAKFCRHIYQILSIIYYLHTLCSGGAPGLRQVTWWCVYQIYLVTSKRMFLFGTSHGYASLLQQRRHTRSVTVISTRPPSCVTLPHLLSIVSEHPLHTSIKYWNDIVSRQHFIMLSCSDKSDVTSSNQNVLVNIQQEASQRL